MKKILDIIQYILLLIIAITVIFYVFIKKNDKSYEDFQNKVNNSFNYFNVNTEDYYNLTKEESPQEIQQNPDELILDIGGAFGEVDASRIPWDSENKQLTQKEAVWGIVPTDARIALFKKIYLANQLDNFNNLRSDQDRAEFYYQDPLFGFGTNNRDVAENMGVFNQLLGFGMTALGVKGAFEEASERKAAMALKKIEETPVKKNITEIFSKARLNGVVAEAKGKVVEFLEKNITENGKIKPFKALKSGGKGFYKIFMKAIKLKYLMMGLKFIGKMIMKYIAVSSVLYAIPPPMLGIVLGFAYDAIITPLLFFCDSIITSAMDKWGGTDGTCPSGTTALDILIPAPANMVFELVPVLGDLFGFFYPYVCSDNKTGALVLKGPLNLPKYIGYPWLSSYFWSWPNYKGDYLPPKIVGKTLCTKLSPGSAGYCAVLQKKANPNPYDLYETVYYWGDNTRATLTGTAYADNYYNFNRIIDLGDSDPSYSELNYVSKKMNGMTPEYKTEYFFRSELFPPNSKFFYADFSDPTMLVQMAQFYYNSAIANPVVDYNDGSYNIEIISKINYVIASSLFTCDIECEMLNIKYDPNTGSNYSEYITLNHDRRFYFNVNYSNKAPYYWEDTNNKTAYYSGDSNTSEWKELDDRYDNAMYNLNEYLHRYTIFKPSDVVTAELFVTAYEQIQNTGTVYSNLISSSNYSQDDYNIIYSNYSMSQENYNDIFDEININANKEFLTVRVSTVVGIKDELWEKQKELSPVSSNNIHPQYSLYGCTHLDYTAGAAAAADLSAYQADYRKRVNFDVLPYISRCKNTLIDINKCIDLSNIEQVIKQYKEEYPNKDIKSIVNIKAQGTNGCKFTWDETTSGQNDLTRKTYNILYQTDLSSCTFCLPNKLVTQGSPELPSDPNIKMYKNPITNPISQLYNPEYNTILSYKKGYYFKPVITSNGPLSNVSFEKVPDVDTIPRYDPSTYEELPDLVRPKKPIRIYYPPSPETHLFNGSNDVCSNPDTLNKFILDYNSQNTSNKILSIVKAFTSSSNSCDLEVDILIKYSENSNVVQRRTLSFNMKEGFENIYTYDSLKNNDGLYITRSTKDLESPYSETGVTYGKPFVNNYNPTVISNISYFNNDLVTNFTTNTSQIVKNTQNMIIDLKGAQYLGNDSTNCKKKCDDPIIMQRMLEQYNNDNQAKGRYNQDNLTMYTIFKSATESADKCHLYFAQTDDYYADFYAPNKTSSNNYISESRPALRRVSMKQLPGTCDFVPVAGQIYLDISASDLALQAGIDVYANDSNFYTPVRNNCTNLNCKDTSLINAAIQDYQTVTGNSVKNIVKTLKVGNDTCDYNIIQDFKYQGYTLPNIESVLRVRYKYPLYRNSQTCAPFTYERATNYDETNYVSDTFELQFAETLDATDPSASPILSYINNPNDPIKNVIQNIP